MSQKFLLNEVVYDSVEQFVQEGRGCATTRPNRYEITRNDQRLRAVRAEVSAVQRVEINVQFFHIVSGLKGHISDQMRLEQITVLNRCFQDTGFVFKYDPSTVRVVANDAWYAMGPGTSSERQAKKSLQATPERNLNFYTGGLAPGLLGWATFPWEMEGDRAMDGVVIQCNTLPGGTAAPYNLGMTAVHEIAHWLGLYHTFQGGCDGHGDQLADTIAHGGPNFKKPQPGDAQNNACMVGQQAPIYNYMNYVDDDCMREFTQLQVERMKMHLLVYRPGFIVG